MADGGVACYHCACNFVPYSNEKSIDWEQRRFEASKAAMQGIMSSNECDVGHVPPTVAEWAVSIADALISELKNQNP